jgi:hypothetical protein
MICDRGYSGSVVQLRRTVARLRPQFREAFLQLQTFPGEQAQVDWAHFGHVMVGRAKRALSCFVMTLSYSRALYLEFFFDQTMENFLRGHVHAFEYWPGQPRVILYDNLKSAVLERRGNQIQFHPRLIELSAHYHFAPRPCQVRAGNQKGRVERAIRYVRDSFWAGRTFTTLAECNHQALLWRDQVAHQRRWPGGDSRIVADVFAEEQSRLLPPALHAFSTDRIETARSRKTIYVRFDLNDYSIPPEAVGRQLTLVVSDITVRILDGLEIARHARTYDRHQLVLDPAHQEAVLKIKRKAFHSTPGGRIQKRRRKSNTLIWPSRGANRAALKRPNWSNCWSSMAPPPCAEPSSKHCNAAPHGRLRWRSCCAVNLAHTSEPRSQPSSASSVVYPTSRSGPTMNYPHSRHRP